MSSRAKSLPATAAAAWRAPIALTPPSCSASTAPAASDAAGTTIASSVGAFLQKARIAAGDASSPTSTSLASSERAGLGSALKQRTVLHFGEALRARTRASTPAPLPTTHTAVMLSSRGFFAERPGPPPDMHSDESMNPAHARWAQRRGKRNLPSTGTYPEGSRVERRRRMRGKKGANGGG